MKRLLAILLCLVMALSLIPAAAAEDIGIVDVEPAGDDALSDPSDDLIEIVDAEAISNANPIITDQPVSLTIGAGGTAKFTVMADGATAYQWYWRENKNDSWHKATVSSATTKTLVYTNLSSGKSGRQYYCKVSNADGYVYSRIVTLTVLAKPEITAQPESLTIRVGDTARFTVMADGVTAYQWYWRENKDDSWHKATVSTATSGTLVYTNLSASKSGRQYRCKLSNAEGYVYSKTVTLTVTEKPLITEQPADKSAGTGSTVKFTVSADGADSYQWYYRTSSSGSWKKSSGTGATGQTLTVKAASYRNGYQYRCKVSNSNGYVYSKAAKLTVGSKPVFTTQPTSYIASAGMRLMFTVKVSDAASYQWYFRTSSSGSWSTCTSAGNKSNTMQLEAVERRNGYQYRCKATNTFGSTWSETLTLTVVTEMAGNGVYWSLDSSGLLTIEGYGDPYDFEDHGPWYEYREDISRLSVSSTVKKIGSHAFCDCFNLTNVYVVDGLTEIGPYAFAGCENLKNFDIRNGVTTIGDHAFYGCEHMTKVWIADSLTVIGESAFALCYDLEEVYYAGTQAQWNKISIAGGNDPLLDASITFEK